MLTNVRSERVRSLRGLSRRGARERSGRFLVEGPQAVREALALHHRRRAEGGAALVHEVIVVAQAGERYADLLARAQADHVLVTSASIDVVAALSETVHPQGLVAVCSQVTVDLGAVVSAVVSDAREGRSALVAVLGQVRDPGNAGTVLRAADAAGATGVILTDDSVDVHNAKCVRASAGSLFHLPVSTGRSLDDIVRELRAAGCVVLAADGRADAEDLDDLLDAAQAGTGPLRQSTAWIFGNEAHGLGPVELGLADHVVRVPIHGAAESLNLAAAAAICLYASARVRRAA